LGIDQKELGAILSVSQPVVSDWERGRYEPSARSLNLLGNLAHGEHAIYFWQVAGVDPSRIDAAFGARIAARLPVSLSRGESNVPPELIAALPDLEWKKETSLPAAAQILRRSAAGVVSLIESGKIKARRVHPKGSYIVDLQSAIDYWLRSEKHESEKILLSLTGKSDATEGLVIRALAAKPPIKRGRRAK
jgi:transcriptional regulator with XRE-family HTH domain